MDDETLLSRYIALDREPDGARVRGHDVAVWVLIRDLLVARGNVLEVAAAYALPQEAVVAAHLLSAAPSGDRCGDSGRAACEAGDRSGGEGAAPGCCTGSVPEQGEPVVCYLCRLRWHGSLRHPPPYSR